MMSKLVKVGKGWLTGGSLISPLRLNSILGVKPNIPGVSLGEVKWKSGSIDQFMTITELVKNRTAKFLYFREGEFIYRIELENDVFDFPVPLADLDKATLLAEDKAIFFMRWARKHL